MVNVSHPGTLDQGVASRSAGGQVGHRYALVALAR
jgi:hypothetical protein